jgi:hypothetical protein
VEVLVASALMAVALVVLLGSLSSLLIGSRIAERRTVEERLARTQIECLVSKAATCPAPSPVDGVTYTVKTVPKTDLASMPGIVELTVTVSDPSGQSESLSIDRVQP